MAKVFSWGGAGLANGVITTASVGTGDNAFAFVQGSPEILSGRMWLPSNDQAWYVRTPTFDLTAHTVRTYFKIDTFSTTGSPIIINAFNDTVQVWRLSISSGGNLQLRDGTNVVVRTGPLIATATWYRIEIVVHAGGIADFYVFDGSEVSIFTSLGMTVGSGFTHAQFGRQSSTVTGNVYYDDMAVGNTAALLGSTGVVATVPATFSWGGTGLANQPLTTLTEGTGDSNFYKVQGTVNVVSQALQIPIEDGTYYAEARVLPATTLATRFYLQTGSRATRSLAVVSAYADSEPEALLSWQITISPDGIIQLRDADKVVRVDGPVLATNVKFHIEVIVTAGTAKMYIWNPNELLIYESATVPVGPKTGSIQFGKGFPDAVGPIVYDSIKMVNNANIIGPASTVTPPPPSNLRIAIIGDSMLRQGGSGEALYRSELIQRGWSDDKIWFYAVDGKRIRSADSNGYSTLDNIDQARAAIGEPDVWVIALGMDGRTDDDGTTISNVGSVLSAIGGTKKVIWINVGIKDDLNADVLRRNLVLLNAIDARGGKSKVADWFSFIHDGRDQEPLWNSTGIALTSDGFRERIRFFGASVGNASDSQPTATAGFDRTAEPGATIALAGIDADSDGTVIGRFWKQISGTPVTITGSGAIQYYVAPVSLDGEQLRFSYKVTDDDGQTSPDSLVTHTVLPINERAIIGGVQVPITILQTFDI